MYIVQVPSPWIIKINQIYFVYIYSNYKKQLFILCTIYVLYGLLLFNRDSVPLPMHTIA